MNTVEFTALIGIGSLLAGFLGALTGLGGGVVVVPLLALVGVIGLSVGLILDRPASFLIGLMCLGVGLALVIPMVFSACGHIRNVHAGTAIAMVSACGWSGFVLGPPLIGGIATLTTLRTALFLLPLLTAVVVAATATAQTLRSS